MASMEARSLPSPGRLGRTLIRLLMKRATVTANETLADRFRLIALEGPGLMGILWTPGQKIQIAMGSAFVARTYTPIAWNADTGRTCILGYAHGTGPGSDWLRAAVPGTACDIFGPRVSIDIGRPSGPLVVFGDETAIGLAYALAYSVGVSIVAGLFEVGDVEISRSVTSQLNLENCAFFAREVEDAHLPALERELSALASAGAMFVLAGKAASIQRVRRSLKLLDVPSQRIRTKAYWAPGKAGLD